MDRHAIEACGIPAYTLMRRAGQAAFESLRRAWPDAGSATILCGAGNNAGDGYVLAARLREAGIPVSVIAITDPERLQALRRRPHGVRCRWRHCACVRCGGCAEAPLVVDACSAPASRAMGWRHACLHRRRECERSVRFRARHSLGPRRGHGLVRGAAIRATRTLTFVGLNRIVPRRRPDHVGVLEFAGLELPPSALAGAEPLLQRLDSNIVAGTVAARRRAAHKGEHGRVLIVGGHAMAGAARLAGEAALRTGAGPSLSRLRRPTPGRSSPGGRN